MKIPWVLKALVQTGVSLLPNHEKINYIFQKYITKRLPFSDATIVGKASVAVTHFNYFTKYYPYTNLSDLVFYEFGAGWDLNVPLAFYMLGVDHQLTIDINSFLRLELFNHAAKTLEANKEKIQDIAGKELRAFSKLEYDSKAEIKDLLGIEYLAPFDARNTKLQDNSVDFISNTVVLAQIPPADLLLILKESYRILKKGGVFSAQVDLTDQYHYTDKKIFRFNFLKYSDFIWSFLNSSLSSQSRLRYPQYMDLIAQTDFEILEQNINKPSAEDLDDLKNMNIDKQFRKFSPEELGIRSFWIVLRKP